MIVGCSGVEGELTVVLIDVEPRPGVLGHPSSKESMDGLKDSTAARKSAAAPISLVQVVEDVLVVAGIVRRPPQNVRRRSRTQSATSRLGMLRSVTPVLSAVTIFSSKARKASDCCRVRTSWAAILFLTSSAWAAAVDSARKPGEYFTLSCQPRKNTAAAAAFRPSASVPREGLTPVSDISNSHNEKSSIPTTTTGRRSRTERRWHSRGICPAGTG